MLNHIVRSINNFENMNFMIYWWGIKYLKIFICFMVNAISHDDSGIALKFHNFV
jgi:hypothetical protein